MSSSAPLGVADSGPSRRVATALFVPVVVAVVAAQVGDALTTTWADTHPLPLMMLNSRNRILLLTSNQVDAATFYMVGTVRLMLTDPLYFLLGYFWGPQALAWIGEKFGGSSGGFARLLAWVQRHFDRAAVPFILVMPNPLISMMAGAAQMRVRVFFTLNLVGTVGRLVLLRRLGEAFEQPIEAVLDFFARYRLLLLALSVLLVSASVIRSRRRGDGELGNLRSLEDKLQDDHGTPGGDRRREPSRQTNFGNARVRWTSGTSPMSRPSGSQPSTGRRAIGRPRPRR